MRSLDVPLTGRQALFYDCVAGDIVALRAPHRPAHIALVREWMVDGRLLMCGALGDPAHSALLVFTSGAQRFAELDPCVTAGIVAA